MNKKRLLLQPLIIAVIIILYLHINPAQAFATIKHNKINTAKPVEDKWGFKRQITVDNRDDRLVDAVVQVEFDNKEFDYTKAKADGADIRFTTSGKLIGNGLPYWIEQWNKDGVTRIWVKIPVLKSKGRSNLVMYYGNLNAGAVSNGNNTFLFFDDFKSGDYSKKWKNVSVDQMLEQDGLLKLRGYDNKDGTITTDFNVTGQMIVRTLYQRGGADQHWTRAGVGGWNNWLCFGDYTDFAYTGTNYVMLFDSASTADLKSKPLVKAANKVITDKWRRVAYWYDGHNLFGMQDDVTVTWPMLNASSKLALRTLDNDALDSFAYIAVSAYLNTEPIVTIGQEQKK